jgi:hypothetical protein
MPQASQQQLAKPEYGTAEYSTVPYVHSYYNRDPYVQSICPHRESEIPHTPKL